MTSRDDDADLAAVTDLFGARSRRQTPFDTEVADSWAPRDVTELPDRRDQKSRTDGSGHWGPRDATEVPDRRDPEGGTDEFGRWGADSEQTGPEDEQATSASDEGTSTSEQAVPEVRHLTPVAERTGSEPEWRSPVVGDGSGRSARAEQDGYGDSADARTASVFAIADGSELDPADAPRPVAEQRADAERISMKALGRKGVSTSELRKALARHELDDDVIEHEVERLTRVGLLDDVALATDLVDRLHERKGLGRQGVVAELRRRGIDQSAIDQALDAAADDADDEFVRANELAEHRARQLRGLDRATAERRLSGFLMRKGYSGGVVRVAVERALDGSAGRGGAGRGPTGGSVRFE